MTTAIVRTPTGWCQQYHVAGRVINGPTATTREQLDEIIRGREELMAALKKPKNPKRRD
jgi:hypothetical protein